MRDMISDSFVITVLRSLLVLLILMALWETLMLYYASKNITYIFIFNKGTVDSISWYDDIELFSYELIIFRNDYSLTFACLEPDPAIYLNNFGTSVVLL